MTHTPEQHQELSELAASLNEKLENAGQSAANQAFNLGCSVAVIPALIVMLIVYIVARSNWISIGGALVIVLLAVIGFANFAAYRARTNTIARTYQRDIHPEIVRTLNKMELDLSGFNQAAREVLPVNAVLLRHLGPASTTGQDNPQTN